MIYQSLQLGDPPYRIGYRETAGCPEHKHIEVELFYCTEGSYHITIDRTEFFMRKGDIAIIGSMVSHTLSDTCAAPNSTCLVIEAGPTMLGTHFTVLAAKLFPDPIFHLNCEEHAALYSLMEETEYWRAHPTQNSRLIIKGNIYKIFAYILDHLVSDAPVSSKESITTINVENALQHIYNNYDKKVTVEQVAEMCGYSTANFCRIFKMITGKTFHAVLNHHRIRVACILLKDSVSSVEDIATQVGFGDSKSFCRVFKAIIGMSPGAYRKSTNTQ